MLCHVLTKVARVDFCDLQGVKQACIVYIFSKPKYLTWSDKQMQSCKNLPKVQESENYCFSGVFIMNKWHKYVRSRTFDVYRDRSKYETC